MDSRFSKKVALVTGGAAGLGRGLCEALASRGAHVVVADMNGERAEQLAQSLRDAGGQASALSLDVTDSGAVPPAIDSVVQARGRIDYLFNNAGIAVGGELQDVPPATFEKIVSVNLVGAYAVLHACYRHMLDQGDGHIVNIASMWGLLPGVVQSAYTATKHGLTGLSTALAAEARDRGVYVTAVCPGYINTELFESGTYGGNLNAKAAVERIPFDMMSVQDAVTVILHGVAKRRLIVAFPSYVRVSWLLHRISPSLFCWISRRILSNQRKQLAAEAGQP